MITKGFLRPEKLPHDLLDFPLSEIMENIPLPSTHIKQSLAFSMALSLMLCEHKLLPECLTRGSRMGFRDPESPLEVYNIFMCRHIFLGRVQTLISLKSMKPKGCKPSHRMELIFITSSSLTSLLPLTPCSRDAQRTLS